jgi:hypothetical protein
VKRLVATACIGIGTVGVMFATALPAYASSVVAVLYNNDTSQNFPCTHNKQYSIPAAANGGIALLDNECNVRVWIHQDADGGGWGYCFSPGQASFVVGKAEDPKNLQVTENTAAC